MGGAAGAPTFVPFAHPPFPVLKKGTGGVLAKVQLVTVTFAGWKGESHAHAYGDALVKSEWLATVGADYGVGKGDHLAEIVLAETAPATIDDSEFPAFLTQRINAGTLPKPATAKNDFLYVLYFPSTTKITQSGETSCNDFGAYHYAATIPGVGRVAYAPIPECPGGIGETESAVSHEVIEAATDPDPQSPTWNMLANPWTRAIFPGFPTAEVGDVCFNLNPWKEGSFTYTRSWSMSAAAAGKEPCVPTLAGVPAFGVVPPATTTTATAGQQVTITVTGWSDAAMPNWLISLDQVAGTWGIGGKFSSVLINNGFTSNLVFTVPANAAKGPAYFFIDSTYKGEVHHTPVVVTVK